MSQSKNKKNKKHKAVAEEKRSESSSDIESLLDNQFDDDIQKILDPSKQEGIYFDSSEDENI